MWGDPDFSHHFTGGPAKSLLALLWNAVEAYSTSYISDLIRSVHLAGTSCEPASLEQGVVFCHFPLIVHLRLGILDDTKAIDLAPAPLKFTISTGGAGA
jgi:hypothetical protein